MGENRTTEQAVFDLYRSYPFPQTSARQRREWLPLQLCKYRFLGVEEAWRGRVLDVGCGTGRTMLAPKHYGTQQYVGLDQSEPSLAYAMKVAREDDVPEFLPLKASLFETPFPDEYFDLVVAWGVLHCTPDPVRGLKEMVRVCKPGGFVAFMVFNPFAHWRNNLERRKVFRLAGPDVNARFEVAHRLYGKKPISEMTPPEKVEFVDRYCVPIESNHGYAEILSWFDRLGLEYWGSSPPLRFRDAIRYLQTYADLKERHRTEEFSTRFLRSITKLARLSKALPVRQEVSRPFARPTILHRAIWQTLLAWIGPRYGASSVSSFSARKPIRRP